MKNLFLLAVSAAIILCFEFCENKTARTGSYGNATGENTSGASTELPPGKNDSLAGFPGCERAAWSPLTTNSEEFIYQHYVVKITRPQDGSGEEIVVKRDSGRADFTIPIHEGGRFYGISRNRLFVDAGTGPNNREVYVYDLDRMLQLFGTPYCGDLQIVQSEKIRYLVPVEEQDVVKMPECPEKSEWEKKGLRVGYGQRCLFNFVNRSLTRKSEWECVPLQ